MKAYDLGMEILGVPGVECIRVEPFEHYEGGVHILVRFEEVAPLDLDVKELKKLVTALDRALIRAEQMVDSRRLADGN